MIDPLLHQNLPVILLCIADHNFFDACIDDHLFTHGAAVGILHILPCCHLPAGQVKGTSDHLFPFCTDNGISLSMNTTTELIPLSPRYFHFLPDASPQITAVFPSSRGSYISGRDHLIIFHDNGTIMSPQAGSPL